MPGVSHKVTLSNLPVATEPAGREPGSPVTREGGKRLLPKVQEMAASRGARKIGAKGNGYESRGPRKPQVSSEGTKVRSRGNLGIARERRMGKARKDVKPRSIGGGRSGRYEQRHDARGYARANAPMLNDAAATDSGVG